MSKSGKSSKKILIVMVDFANGGIESFLYNVLSHIHTNDLSIDIAFNRKYDEDNFLSKILKYTRKTFRYGGPLCYSPFFYLPRLFWLMKKHGPYDVIYANAGLLNGFVVFFGNCLHIQKRISHLHTQENPSVLIQRLKKWICEGLIRRFATLNLSPSKTVFQCFNPPLIPAKVETNGISVKTFAFNSIVREKIRTQLHIDKNTLLIGHVGRFDKVKNHAFLLQIFKEIHELYPQSILLLIGSGKQASFIQQSIKDLNLDKQVILLKNTKEINSYYQAMDAFVFPSLREGFGMVVVEAQCAGLPCFISDGVPTETMICNTTQIPLAKSAKEWAKIILAKLKDFHRQDCSSIVKKTGYDIQNVAEKIYTEYLK